MRTLVLGAAGMLGHKVVQQLAAGPFDLWYSVRGSLREPHLGVLQELGSDRAIEHMDAGNASFEDQIRNLRPDVVINCLGVIKQRSEAANEALCARINAELPWRLATLLAGWGGRLVHFSTDCVFDGARGNYNEHDTPNATDIYGRSKAMGEVSRDNAIVIRTSFIGRELRHHKSLLDWFLSQNGKRIFGFRRAIWSGVSTLHMARALETIILRNAKLAGIYHLSSAALSKYELLLRLREAYNVDVEIEPDDALVRDFSLDCSKLQREAGYVPEPWPSQLATLVSDPTSYPPLGALQGVPSTGR